MINKDLIISRLFIAYLCFVFIDASAHSGRTNSQGCHNNRKTGDYHCHNGGSIIKNNSINSYNSNSYRKSTSKNCSRVTCQSIYSCEIAVYKLYQCNHTRLDGDGDGIPCEKICSINMVSNILSKQTFATENKKELIYETQKYLKKLGFYTGKIDGLYGRKTKSAILDFQKQNLLVENEEINQQLLNQLKQAKENLNLKLVDIHNLNNIDHPIERAQNNLQALRNEHQNNGLASTDQVSSQAKPNAYIDNQIADKTNNNSESDEMPWWLLFGAGWLAGSYFTKRKFTNN